MKAAVLESPQSVPQYKTFDDPVPQPGETVVRVLAAGLHPVVKSRAKGSHYTSAGRFPLIPGIDGVGRLEDGRRVFFAAARQQFGTFAELCIAHPQAMFPLSDAIPDATAAALGNPAMSSWGALSFRANFQPGQSVLILGATGTAGQLAVQIAKRRGAKRVIACGRNPQALEKTKSLGADATISLELPREELVAAVRSEVEAGVNIVLDYVWGSPAEATLEAIARRDNETMPLRYVQIGQSAGRTIPLDGATLRSSAVELVGSGFGSVALPDLLASIAEFFEEAARAPFEIGVRTFPLSDIASVWDQPEGDQRFVFIP
ncbi:MAG TPA: zinc-binding alcohol dehydrogenase family protein [Acidobacteriaceae bacterium]|jgi:NADPH2:quinone reductase